uniref:Uncharacterized protein n=1 Tax=Eptatretus burgeri TaxID=7764 RepID=A0A8C4QE85_EPTBU
MLSRFPETTANPSFLDPGQSSLRFQDTNSTVPRFNNRTMEISTVQGNESHCPGTPDPFGTSGSRFTTPGLQFLGLQAGSSNNFSGTGNYGGPVSFVEPAMRAEGGKRSQVGYAKTEAELARAQQLALEKDYIVLQSTAKEGKGAECTGGLGSDYSGRGGSGVIQRTASYPHRTLHHPRPHTSNTLTSLPEIDKGLIRQLMKGETGSTASVNSLDRRKTRYSELDFQKIMHTRKRHHEMLHEMSQKFQTMERGRPMPLDAIKMQDQMRGRWNPSSPANESIAESPLDALHAYWADENAGGWARKMP